MNEWQKYVEQTYAFIMAVFKASQNRSKCAVKLNFALYDFFVSYGETWEKWIGEGGNYYPNRIVKTTYYRRLWMDGWLNANE